MMRGVAPGQREGEEAPVPFTFVSGNLALDFAGTLRYRATAPEDLLSSPALLREWLVAADLVDSPPAVSGAELARALEVREAVYRLALASVGGGQPSQDDIELVNAAAAAAPVTVALTLAGLRRSGTMDAIVSTLARAAVTLLGGPDAARIRECEDPPCSRLFVDTSRAGSRRWCEMSGCGNRTKAAGFRARHSARPPGQGARR
jgi:predicted RNA-binding Zn ribbon-like protein